MKRPGRRTGSPYRYDRAAIRYVLEHDGLDAARARWPREVVDPIARVLGLTKPYNNRHHDLTPEQVAALGTKPDQVLAGEWGVPRETVRSLRTKLGVPVVLNGWGRRQRQARLAALPDRDLLTRTCDEIAGDIHVPATLIAAERRRRGIRVTRQGASYRAPLTARRLTAIRALRCAYPAITLEELAEVFGLTRERIRQLEEMAVIEPELRGDRHLMADSAVSDFAWQGNRFPAEGMR